MAARLLMEYRENETTTYEVIAIGRKGESAYVDSKVVYRFWPVGDGDWRLQVIDSDKAPIEPILIPKKVVDKIINVVVKKGLKE